MQTVVVTDVKYRASIAAIRMLHRAGYRVIAVQTRGDCDGTPPAFYSCCAAQTRWLDGSSRDTEFPSRLAELLKEYDNPVLLCVWGVTLDAVSAHQEELSRVCRFLVAPKQVLSRLNDKEQVHHMARRLGIAVPQSFSEGAVQYPVVVKPHCGEKKGLKAGDRYAVARNAQELEAAKRKLTPYDPSGLLIQEQVGGDGVGVSILMGRDGKKYSALCHRRIREYPTAGGPSACCESFYDARLIDLAERLLTAFSFCGIAMVEFKGDKLLEVNPRIWGSFPLADKAGSPFLEHYVKLSLGECVPYQPADYITGLRMHFLLNDTAAAVQYARNGQLGKALGYFPDLFRAKEAIFDPKDTRPFCEYLRSTVRRRSHGD